MGQVTEYLASWNDGPAKRSILDFVEMVTTKGPGFVPVADRIATFDNDGTMWVEQPAPPQADFLIRAWGQAVADDPSLGTRQPWKAIVEHDDSYFRGLATQDPEVVASLERAVATTWAGTTPDVYDAEVREWIQKVKQPNFNAPYTSLVYQPMLELFEFLKANDFRVLLCSGGGRDFMRVFVEEAMGLYKEAVIGSASAYRYEDGQIVRTDQMLGALALGAGKPEHIYAHTGRLPVVAGGNADVDIEMLETALFSLLIVHDDDEREFAYTASAEKAVAKAKELDWTLVSMRNDWLTVFAHDVPNLDP